MQQCLPESILSAHPLQGEVEFSEKIRLILDKPKNAVIIHTKTEHLIKSGGGNGPVKPGNLRRRGAKSGGDYREMRLITKKQNPSVTTDFFVDTSRSVFG